MSDTPEDFRSRRIKLPPEAFAYAPGPEPEPSDLIDPETWSSLVFLPDDVSIRTTDHNGSVIRHAYESWGDWVAFVLDVQSVVATPSDDPLALACLNVGDELQASTYLVLTGFYRQSIAVLRSALEGVVVGCHFRAHPDPDGFAGWADGEPQGRQRFQKLRQDLAKIHPFSLFEAAGTGELGTLMGDHGVVNFVYGATSAFSHGRPFWVNRWGDKVPSSNVGLWGGSNGPVYEPRSVRLWSMLYFDTATLCLLLAALSEPRLATIERPQEWPIAEMIDRFLDWHPAPNALYRKIRAYVAAEGGR